MRHIKVKHTVELDAVVGLHKHLCNWCGIQTPDPSNDKLVETLTSNRRYIAPFQPEDESCNGYWPAGWVTVMDSPEAEWSCYCPTCWAKMRKALK